MKRVTVAAAGPLVIALVLAGCGSSAKSSSSASSSPAGTTPSQSSSSAASSSSSPPAAKPAALITTKHSKLGTILAAGSKKLTVYLFEADKGPSSTCSGECAKVWPPVTGKPTSAGNALSSDLGTITRSDGTTQVTYKAHPLYLYIKDKDSSDTYGQGSKLFGAGWYVLAPSGKKVDNS